MNTQNTEQRRTLRRKCQQIGLSMLLSVSFLQFSNVTEVDQDQAHQSGYIQSGFGSLQDVSKAHKKLNKHLSVNISQFKSLRQNFGSASLQDSLEANSSLGFSYEIKNSMHISSNFGFTYSKQDISSIASENIDTQHERMLYGSLGLDQYFLRDLKLNTSVGMVHCRDYSTGEVNLYPTASLTLSKDIQTVNVAFSLASEALGGGSFTGVYGNQMLHHGKVAIHIPVGKKLGIRSDVAFGQTRDAFEGDEKGMIFASSVSIDYQIHKNVTFGMGIFSRSLTNEDDFQNPVKEGAMYMATMSVSYF